MEFGGIHFRLKLFAISKTPMHELEPFDHQYKNETEHKSPVRKAQPRWPLISEARKPPR